MSDIVELTNSEQSELRIFMLNYKGGIAKASSIKNEHGMGLYEIFLAIKNFFHDIQYKKEDGTWVNAFKELHLSADGIKEKIFSDLENELPRFRYFNEDNKFPEWLKVGQKVSLRKKINIKNDLKIDNEINEYFISEVKMIFGNDVYFDILDKDLMKISSNNLDNFVKPIYDDERYDWIKVGSYANFNGESVKIIATEKDQRDYKFNYRFDVIVEFIKDHHFEFINKAELSKCIIKPYTFENSELIFKVRNKETGNLIVVNLIGENDGETYFSYLDHYYDPIVHTTLDKVNTVVISATKLFNEYEHIDGTPCGCA